MNYDPSAPGDADSSVLWGLQELNRNYSFVSSPSPNDGVISLLTGPELAQNQ